MTAFDVKAVEDQLKESERINSLINQRNELLRKVLTLNSEIEAALSHASATTGCNTPAPVVEERVVTTQQPVEAVKPTGSKRGRKPKGEMSLANHILLLVQGSASGLDRAEIVHLLLKNGYQSGSKKFADVVASTLSSLKAKSRITVSENGKFVSQK